MVVINLAGVPNSPRIEGRNGDIWLAYIKGSTQQRIAAEYGITPQAVSEIIKRAREQIPPQDKAAALEEQLELIRELRRRALELVDMAPAPVFVGKDGTIAYDEDGNPVKDYSFRLKAMDAAARFADIEAKRLGLDAATKIETSGSVRFELVGISVEDLQ